MNNSFQVDIAGFTSLPRELTGPVAKRRDFLLMQTLRNQVPSVCLQQKP